MSARQLSLAKAPLTPPHDLTAEDAVLSAILLEPAALDIVSKILKADDFYSPANAWIYRAAIDLCTRQQPVDSVTVCSWLKSRDRLAEIGGIASLTRIVDETPSVANVEAHANIVLRLHQRRLMISAAQKIVAEGYGPIDDETEFLERSVQSLTSIVSARRSSEEVDFADAAFQFLNELADTVQRGEILGLTTGLRTVDEATGGLYRGEVTIIAGRPGMGKSALALDVCMGAIQKSRGELIASYVVSAEMPPKMLAARGVCGIAGVPLAAARTGNLHAGQWDALSRSLHHLHEFPIRIRGRMPSIQALRSSLREYKRWLETHPAPDGTPIHLGIVVVDYIQLVTATIGRSSRGQSQEEMISEVALGLQDLAKEFDVAMVLLSQLNRGVESRLDKRPGIADLKGSGAIEAVADLILLLYRDDYYHPDSQTPGIVEVIIGKQRSGKTGKIILGFDASLTSFRDLSDGDLARYAHLLEERQ